ncbi:MAG: hypothetical protein ABW217_11165 [Polyangiaceae bacterium]
MRRWRNAENARTERWKRENEAQRLKAVVPVLASLRFDLDEMNEGHSIGSSRCVRHIMVATAAALFEIPCSDTRCEQGGHDITHDVLRELAAAREEFTGEDVCRGSVGDRGCGRVLKYIAHAKYTK